MHTVIEWVSPARAEEIMQNNQSNRKLRKSTVDSLRRAILRGEWKLTHQGIALSPEGRLLDGQHRLRAIQMAGIPVQMNISYAVPESVFDVLDIGAKRSLQDITGIHQKVLGPLVELAKIVYSETRPSAAFITKELGTFIPVSQRILEFCPSVRKNVKSVVRSALIVRLLQNPYDSDYMLNLYRHLVLSTLDKLPPIGLSFYRQTIVHNHNNYDWFCLAYKTFDEQNKDLERIYIKKRDDILEEAKEFVREYVKKA